MVWHKTIGSGPSRVVVIHGWFWDHRVFTPIFDSLDTDSFIYAFIDIRGYGHSRNVSGDYSIGEVAADVIALADRLGWREFHVVGHSMGGKAAQKVAMDAGTRVRSVVAVTPVPAVSTWLYGPEWTGSIWVIGQAPPNIDVRILELSSQ